MNKYMMVAMMSFAAGIYVGYCQEETLEDLYRKSCRTKKKAVKKMHKAYDSVCDCMHMD